MATFLILPPRELLEHAVCDFLGRIFPGVPASNARLAGVLDLIAGEAFVVHREDLPESADLPGVLADAFGAEAGDRVVEVGPPRAGSPSAVREWVLPGHVSAGRAAR